MKNVLEWANQHKKVAIGAGVGVVALVVAAVVAVLGITGVIPTGNIFAGGDITRGEWIKMFGEKFNMTNYDQTEPYYTDVKSDDEIFSYVQTLVENEVMSGEGEAKLNEKITLEEAYIQLAKNYGDNYVKGALGNEELTDKDWVTFLTEKAEVSTERMNKGFSKKAAEELLDKVYNHYLNRQFRNIGEVDYAENVIDLSDVKNYKYVGNKLVINTNTDISEGKIIVLGENDQYVSGLAVKVDKVSKNGSAYELEVKTPKLNEVVDSFYLEMSKLVNFDNFVPAEGVTIVNNSTSKNNDHLVKNEFHQVLKTDTSKELFGGFDVSVSGDILSLDLDLTDGEITSSVAWEKIGSELEFSKAEAYQYVMDERGKLTSKYSGGLKIKGGLKVKDLILNGNVEYSAWRNQIEFDVNAGVTVQPSLSIEGKINNKQYQIGSMSVPLGWGFAARMDFYLYVDFEGKISVKPQLVAAVNVKKNAGDSINTTGKCDCEFKSDIKAKAKVEAGPDFVITFLNVAELVDIYANLGVGAEMSYSTDNPLKVEIEVYAPTLEAGVGGKDNTLLSKMGVKYKCSIIGRDGAILKCPFTAKYAYDVLTKDIAYVPETEAPTQSTSENTNGGSSQNTIISSENAGNNSTEKETQNSTQTETQKPTQAPTQTETQKPTQSAVVYKVSSASYDWASAWGKYYQVKKNGLYGVVDFNGNVIVPINYESGDFVGDGEYEFVKGNVGYVYNVNTGKLKFSYKKEEAASNPEEYTIKCGSGVGAGFHYVELKPNGMLKREYRCGMLLEKIALAGGSDKETISTWYKYINYDTKKTIISGYGMVHNIYSLPDWDGVEFDLYGNTAIAIGYEVNAATNTLGEVQYINIISKDGVKKSKFDANYGYYQSVKYTEGWIKSFGWGAYALYNTNTNNEGFNDQDYVKSWYWGRGEYCAISYDGKIYDIYKGTSVISKGWTEVSFDDGKFIRAKNSSGEIVYMDYSGNIKLKVKAGSISFYKKGKMLVADTTGAYYVDTNFNKISDYVYKGNVEACIHDTIKINGKYYLISNQ